jgi:hypothetical protein
MKNIRQIHLFLGTFFAPAIIFFAFSGILQVFGLHESRGPDAAPPAAWIAQLAAIHKDQHLRIEKPQQEDEHHDHEGHEANAHEHAHPAETPASSWALKAFVLLMAISLISTSVLGIYIAAQNPRTRRNAWISLVLGIIVPVLLMFV